MFCTLNKLDEMTDRLAIDVGAFGLKIEREACGAKC
jgi:hypothetical protein